MALVHHGVVNALTHHDAVTTTPVHLAAASTNALLPVLSSSHQHHLLIVGSLVEPLALSSTLSTSRSFIDVHLFFLRHQIFNLAPDPSSTMLYPHHRRFFSSPVIDSGQLILLRVTSLFPFPSSNLT